MLVALVALTPLPLGSNRPLPMALWGLCVGALLLVWGVAALQDKSWLRTETSELMWPIGLYFSVCAWIVVQWFPSVFGNFADPIWQSASDLLHTPLAPRITVDPVATMSGLANLIIYGGTFWLSFQLTRRSRRAWAVINALAAIGCVYALYGIIVFLTGNKWILIYPKWAYPDSLTSTFVNRNSYATFAGLTLLCATASIVERLEPLFALKHRMRAKIVILIEEITTRSALRSFTWVTIALALLLTTSRGGVASTFAGLFTILGLYVSRKRLRMRNLAILISGTGIMVLVIFMASGDRLSERLVVDHIGSSIDQRSEVYAETIDAILSSPFKGTGASTFQNVFPAYRTSSEVSPLLWDKAHNTYLENALELGIPFALVLNLAIALLAYRSARGAVTRKQDNILPALGIGATVLVGLHSLVDFSLQIPAVTIFYATILGVAVGQSWSQRSKRQSSHTSQVSQAKVLQPEELDY